MVVDLGAIQQPGSSQNARFERTEHDAISSDAFSKRFGGIDGRPILA